MQRTDLYRGVHKAIRVLLFDATVAVARADFGRAGEAAGAAGAVRRLVGFLREHAQHEDEVVLPVLARLAPALAADLRAGHARVHGLEAELLALAARLEAARPAERVALGRRIQDRLGRLAAEHLLHLEREEGEANRVLWAHLADPELLALEARIVGSIPRARLAEWVAVLLPALDAGERAALHAGLEAALPADALAEVLAAARSAALADGDARHADRAKAFEPARPSPVLG